MIWLAITLWLGGILGIVGALSAIVWALITMTDALRHPREDDE